jgi:O-antigen/teichoic acid export membrane protein
LSLLRDAGVLQVSAVLRAVAGLLSALGLAHVLGASSQGDYYVAVALFSLLHLCLATGVHTVTVSRVSAAMHTGDAAEARRWLGFHLLVQTAVALLLAGLGTLLPLVAPAVAHADPSVGWLAAALCWTPLLELLRAVTTAMLQATRRMTTLAGFELSAELTRAFLVVAGAVATGTPAGAVAGWLAASALSAPMAWIALGRERESVGLPTLREVLLATREAPLREGLRKGLALGLTRNAGMLMVEVLPALVVARFGSTAGVAYLRIAQRIARAAMMLSTGLSRTALPALGAVVQDARRFQHTWVRATLLSGAVVAAAWGAALVLLPSVLPWLTPPDYQAPVIALAWALTPGVLALGFSTTSEAFHVATNTVRVAFWFVVIGLPIGASCIIVGGWLYSIQGVAWGLSIALAVELAQPVYALWWLRRRARSLSS